MPVPHADESQAHLNEDWREAASPKALRAALEERLSLADRKADTPVLALEYLITAPHEAFEENGGPVAWRAYFKDALAWIERRHGRENVVAVNIQLDETTPHLVAYVCPLVRREATTRTRSVFGKKNPETGRQPRVTRTETVPGHVALSADHYTGTREKMIRMQTEFATEVGERHGLRRGIERSALRHVDLKKYHDALVGGIQKRLQIDPAMLRRKGGMLSRETPEQMAARVAEALQDQVEALMARAATAEMDRQRAREWEETAARAQTDRRREQEAHAQTLRKVASLVGGLSDGEVEKVREYRQKCLDRRHKREAQERAQRAQERQRREEAMMARLRAITPEELAQIPDDEREELWDMLVTRSELAEVMDAMLDSRLFDLNGVPIRGARAQPLNRCPDSGVNHPAEPAQNAPAEPAQNEPPRSFGSPGNGSGPAM